MPGPRSALKAKQPGTARAHLKRREPDEIVEHQPAPVTQGAAPIWPARKSSAGWFASGRVLEAEPQQIAVSSPVGSALGSGLLPFARVRRT